jgi:hypothetical protein
MSPERTECWKEALQNARILTRKHPRWAKAVALQIRAGVANVRQQRQAALELLQQAEAEFRACEMAHVVAACQYRQGTLRGGEEGRAAIATAEAWAVSQRVMNPPRMFDMLAPGRWRTEV